MKQFMALYSGDIMDIERNNISRKIFING